MPAIHGGDRLRLLAGEGFTKTRTEMYGGGALVWVALWVTLWAALGCGDDDGDLGSGDAATSDGQGPRLPGDVRSGDNSQDDPDAIACDSDNQCTPEGLLCNQELGRCAECGADRDCEDTEVCAAGSCQSVTRCDNSLDCVDAAEDLAICDRNRGFCVQCVAAPDCEDDHDCLDNLCVAVERCDNSLDCDSGLVCDPSTSRCVVCITTADCEPGEQCAGDSTCRPGCDSDNDCTPMGQLCDRALGHCIEPQGGARGNVQDVHFDAIDLLFVVDNSGSMREEQAALRVQFPRLIQVLTRGDRDLDGEQDFPPLTDVHLGVVSADMGLVGITGVPSCEGMGDDGVLNRLPGVGVAPCGASYPSFLSYDAQTGDGAQTAQDFACLATLGTEGCGFEQQLEASLKALWPSTGTGISFLGATQGHGDGANAGFLRSDPQQGLSLIGVIVVSDEEDCSTPDTRIFTPEIFLDPSDPLASQDLNMRCFLNKASLYSVQRYIDGLRGLRAGLEELVTFAAIVGVPPDLVDENARAGVDFSDPTQRDAYYDRILDDPRMQERADPNRTPEQGDNLTPSCNTATGRAYPPRRIVEVARGFGENGVVESICLDDFTGATDAIIEAIVRQR